MWSCLARSDLIIRRVQRVRRARSGDDSALSYMAPSDYVSSRGLPWNGPACEQELLGYMSTMVCLFLHTIATGVRKLHALVTRQVQDQSMLSEREK